MLKCCICKSLQQNANSPLPKKLVKGHTRKHVKG